MTAPRTSQPSARLCIMAPVAALLLAGCGHVPPTVTASASKILTGDVQRLQDASRSGSGVQVAGAADQLRADLAAQRTTGQVNTARASAVLDQLAQVLADLAAIPAGQTPSPPPSQDPGHDKGHGKGNGDGGDNGDGG